MFAVPAHGGGWYLMTALGDDRKAPLSKWVQSATYDTVKEVKGPESVGARANLSYMFIYIRKWVFRTCIKLRLRIQPGGNASSRMTRD